MLIVWVLLLVLPLQGFASATICCCAPSMASAQHDHGTASDEDHHASAAQVHDEHGVIGLHDGHHHPADHHAAKCSTCGTCGSCLSMAPSFTTALPASSPQSLAAPFDQHILPSVDLALPERPPRA
jgi:hypothetical protein